MATKNVTCEVKGGKLIVTCDISAAAIKRHAAPTASGKTMGIASTGGFVKIDSPNGWDLSVGVNLIGKPTT